MKIKMSSSTNSFQKETGDKYVYSIDPVTKKAKTGVNVFNVLGLGKWNVKVVIRNGEWVDGELLLQNKTKSQALKFAKQYVEKN